MYYIALKQKRLPTSTRNSIISILHTKNDRDDIKNYRPISLTNNDYKILSKLLQTKMNPVMNHIIGAEQNGFVPGGFIAENNMLMHEIIQHLEEKDDKGTKTKGGAVLFLDFEKAFDRVDHDFMFKVLEKTCLPHRIHKLDTASIRRSHQSSQN